MAAYLFAQLEKAEDILAKRRNIFTNYHAALAPLEAEGLLRLPRVPPDCEPNGHLFYVIVRSEEVRDALLCCLEAEGVNAVFHYVPLHESPAGRRFGRPAGDLSNSESISRRLLRLPCYFGLDEEKQQRVVSLIRRFFESR